MQNKRNNLKQKKNTKYNKKTQEIKRKADGPHRSVEQECLPHVRTLKVAFFFLKIIYNISKYT